MINFFFGLIVGMIGSALFFFAALLDNQAHPADNITDSMRRVAKHISSAKGSVIYPKTDETIAMEDMFERNDQRGEDTEIGKVESNEQM